MTEQAKTVQFHEAKKNEIINRTALMTYAEISKIRDCQGKLNAEQIGEWMPYTLLLAGVAFKPAEGFTARGTFTVTVTWMPLPNIYGTAEMQWIFDATQEKKEAEG